jgi:hypothetical protein
MSFSTLIVCEPLALLAISHAFGNGGLSLAGIGVFVPDMVAWELEQMPDAPRDITEVCDALSAVLVRTEVLAEFQLLLAQMPRAPSLIGRSGDESVALLYASPVPSRNRFFPPLPTNIRVISVTDLIP